MTVSVNLVNGVDVDALNNTIDAVKGQPELAKFQFNVSNLWVTGGHNRSTVNGFHGVLQDNQHNHVFQYDAGEPPVLLGDDEGANPVEFLLHALAACVTTSMVYHAAQEGIEIQAIQSTIQGDIDLRGFLGLDPTVRTGYQNIRMDLKIKTKADDRQFAELASLGPRFSPVFDSITKGVPVSVTAERL